jgi:Aminoglycoside-2''-adenylyltransferase
MNLDNPKPEMTSHDVLEFLALAQAHSIELWIDGGWSVDALLERQTRVHSDLDIALSHKDVPKLRALLEASGYKDVPRDDTRECNLCWAMIWGIRLIFIRLPLMTKETLLLVFRTLENR